MALALPRRHRSGNRGMPLSQADAVRRGLELTVDGARLFTSVQSTWNLLEPSAGDALAEPEAVADRVRVSNIPNALVAALDHWSGLTRDPRHKNWCRRSRG